MKEINIKELIQKSDSMFLKSFPSYVIWAIVNIVKQDEINRVIKKYKDYEGIELLEKLIDEYNIKVEYEGIENLPEDSKCFFVANHPFGLADGLILTHTIGRKYGKLKAIGSDNLRFVTNLSSIIASVNVLGKSSREYVIALEKVFASDTPITHFPSGLVSRLKHGKVEDGDWKKSFVKKAITHQRDVVPIRFYGRNSRLFYAIYLFRKIFYLSTNIELILLPREFLRMRNKTIKVIIGKPISHSSFDKSKTHVEWAQEIKQLVYNMNVTNF